MMTHILSEDGSAALISVTVYVVPNLYFFAQLFILSFLVYQTINFRSTLTIMGRSSRLMRSESSASRLLRGASKKWLAKVSPEEKVRKNDSISFLEFHTLFYVKLSVLAIVIGILGVLMYTFMIAYASPEMWFVFSFLICFSRLLKIYSNTKVCYSPNT